MSLARTFQKTISGIVYPNFSNSLWNFSKVDILESGKQSNSISDIITILSNASSFLKLGCLYVFKDTFITFSSRPKIVKIKGETIVEKYDFISQFDDYTNTNIDKVYKLTMWILKKIPMLNVK